jgi:xanthine dehydrogenase iron-sulfur cluster and FAD-binding subunit A
MAHGQPQAAELKSIAILDFELVDDQHEKSPATVEYRRLRAIRDQLQNEIAASRLYRVVDLAPAAELIAKHRSATQLHACNGCELDIARSLRAERVLVGWVQKVSNLILNINIRIEDAATGAVLLEKSVDLRGNTDETWRRGVSHLVRSMVERNQANR